MNRSRIDGRATIEIVPRRKHQIPRDLRASLTAAVASLTSKYGDEREAARRLGISQASLNRIKQGEQEPGALIIRKLAHELQWTANRVLGLPDVPPGAELSPALLEAMTTGRHRGPTLAAAARMTASFDVAAWRRALDLLDKCVDQILPSERPSYVNLARRR